VLSITFCLRILEISRSIVPVVARGALLSIFFSPISAQGLPASGVVYLPLSGGQVLSKFLASPGFGFTKKSSTFPMEDGVFANPD